VADDVAIRWRWRWHWRWRMAHGRSRKKRAPYVAVPPAEVPSGRCERAVSSVHSVGRAALQPGSTSSSSECCGAAGAASTCVRAGLQQKSIPRGELLLLPGFQSIRATRASANSGSRRCERKCVCVCTKEQKQNQRRARATTLVSLSVVCLPTEPLRHFLLTHRLCPLPGWPSDFTASPFRRHSGERVVDRSRRDRG
jgi:hypothetical protein